MSRIIANIKRCIKWIPIIWNDREYDFTYFLSIIEFKLAQMFEFYEYGNTHLLNADNVANEIDFVLTVLKRYLKNNYCKQEYAQLKQEHGQTKMQFKPYGDDCDEFIGLQFTHTQDNNRAVATWRKLNAKSRKLQQKDFELIFDFLNINLQNWWD